nr:hypothetical protein [Tanacetum cinerariifolium]
IRSENKVVIRNGILCLSAKAVTILGGIIPSLYEEWEMNQKYAGFSRSTLKSSQRDDTGGPPPFKKLQTGAPSCPSTKQIFWSNAANSGPLKLVDDVTSLKCESWWTPTSLEQICALANCHVQLLVAFTRGVRTRFGCKPGKACGEADLRERKTKANDRINLECDETGQDDPIRRSVTVDCKVGANHISDLVKMAVRAAKLKLKLVQIIFKNLQMVLKRQNGARSSQEKFAFLVGVYNKDEYRVLPGNKFLG